MKARQGTYVSHAPHISTVYSWGGLERGDTVRITGMRGKFTFISHTTNAQNDAEWVTVYKDGLRAIDPSRVKKVKING